MEIDHKDLTKLYLRLPIKIKEESVVKNLHPSIIKVYLPRQKSRRWCIIAFENKEKLQEAQVILKQIKIKNKSITLLPYKQKPKVNTAEGSEESMKDLQQFLQKRA